MSARLSSLNEGEGISSKARCLMDLLVAHCLSAREVARRSRVIAEELNKPELTVGHSAVSAWLNGTRRPLPKHQQVLAMILGIPLADVIVACDLEPQTSDAKYAFRETTVIVPNSYQSYRYTLPIRIDINLNQPAIYPTWNGMFNFPPHQLKRHLKRIRSESFGFIPDRSAAPIVHYPHCLVPLEKTSNKDIGRALDSVESSQRRVWFMYLPGGNLSVGVGYRMRRIFMLVRNAGSRLVVEEYPLSRVDLIGYFKGKVIFYLLPHNASGNGAGGIGHNSSTERS